MIIYSGLAGKEERINNETSGFKKNTADQTDRSG